MATFERFEDIDAWQMARQLTHEIYRISRHGAFRDDYDLQRQIRRASVSIMSNIAEGFDRDGSKEFLQFLSQAKGSASEVRAQLYVAMDEQYIDQAQFDHLYRQAERIGRMLAGLMHYLRRSHLRGLKYQQPKPATPFQPETRNEKPETLP